MIIQIITNTPPWVFVLFIGLILLGSLSMRTRTMPLRRLYIVPIILLCVSLAGVISKFGGQIETLLAWIIGYVTVLWFVGGLVANPLDRYDLSTKMFIVAGSVVPLLLMMGIFFVNYFVNVASAMRLDFIGHYLFPIMISLVYGALSGGFAGRTWRLLKLTKSAKQTKDISG